MNSNNIAESFKHIFISQKNSGYLFDLISNKVTNSKPHLKNIFLDNINLYRENMIDIQQLIFKDFFNIIYNKSVSSGNLDLEDILIELNKITVSKFEFILLNDLTNKFQHFSNHQKKEQFIKIPNNQIQQNIQSSQKLHNEKSQQDTNNKQDINNKQDTNKQDTNSKQNTNRKQNINVKKQQGDRQDNNNEDYSQDYNEDYSEDYSEDEDDYKIYYKEFFSENAIYEDGSYKFPFHLQNIKSVNLDKIKIKCNFYNINEYNNKFYLIEQNNKTLITIPIGYYDTEFLLQVISECMNGASINKKKDYYYKVYNNAIKNKICFCSELIHPDRINRPITFGISFLENNDPDKNIPSLQKLLGFHKNDYFNNNFYIADDFSDINIFDELYIKLYINDQEIYKYDSSNKDFHFFESIDVDMNKMFGKTLTLQLDNNPFYINNQNLKMNNLKIILYNSYNSYISTPVWFKFSISFEYIV